MQGRLLDALHKCHIPLKTQFTGSVEGCAGFFVREWANFAASEPILIRKGLNSNADKRTLPPPTGTVIFAHGLGDTGNGWTDAFIEIANAMPHVQFIFPTARNQPVTVNNGAVMPSWYDIKSLARDGLAKDVELPRGLMEASTFLQALAVVAMDGIFQSGGEVGARSNRVVIGGFSQGAAASVFASHTFEDPLAGVVALSGYVNGMPRLAATLKELNKHVPLFVGHGTSDSMVPMDFSKATFDALLDLRRGSKSGAPAAAPPAAADFPFKTYRGMDHGSCPEEMADVAAFLARVLPVVPETGRYAGVTGLEPGAPRSRY